MSRQLTYDTNVLIRYSTPEFHPGLFMSAVVIQELTAGASDEAETRRYAAVRDQFEAVDRLLVPTGEDWWMAGKILWALRHGVRSHRYGRVPAISREEQQRIVRDVLIARTARRANAVVVTENVRDFNKIRRFCDVKVVNAAKHFAGRA